MVKLRYFYRIGLLLAPLLLLATYTIKQQSREMAGRVAQKTRAVEKARTRKDILRAELATLTAPQRIDRLARKYLGLRDVTADQYMRLPERARTPGVLPPEALMSPPEDITATVPSAEPAP